MSDKLDMANKVSYLLCVNARALIVPQNARQHERDANNLRDRLEELEPQLTETQQERFQIQRQSEQQRQERSDLLLKVFKDINRFLGTDVGGSLSKFEADW